VRRLQARAGSDTMLATGALVALNVIFYLAQAVQAGGLQNASLSSFVKDGAVFGPAIADGEWWRLVTGGFLHASIIHIGFNMYLLWILGGALERYAGAGRFLAIYSSAVLWGSVGALIASPNAHTIGASGGVFGLSGAEIKIYASGAMISIVQTVLASVASIAAWYPEPVPISRTRS